MFSVILFGVNGHKTEDTTCVNIVYTTCVQLKVRYNGLYLTSFTIFVCFSSLSLVFFVLHITTISILLKSPSFWLWTNKSRSSNFWNASDSARISSSSSSDSYGQHKLVGHLPFLYSKVFDQSGSYGLEIPFSYHFYSHEKGVNWLKKRLELIGKDIVKETKHYLNDFKEINWNMFRWSSIIFDCT